MEYFTELIPKELIELILLYASEDMSLLDLYNSELFNDIILTPAFIKMVFEHNNYEVVNKDIALYASFDKNAIKKFKKYKPRQLINIIANEYANIEVAHISYNDIKDHNLEIQINIEYINDMSLLYDHIILDEEIELNYMDSKWFLFLGNDGTNIRFQLSDIQLRINKIKNNFTYIFYYEFDPTISKTLKVNNPEELFKKLIINLCYNRTKFYIVIM